MIVIFRVTTGQEKIVLEMLYKKAKAENLPIYSIVHVDNVKGYVFVEAQDENAAVKLAQRVKHVKGILKQPISIDEIAKMITVAKQPALMIEVGDIVEMISGPFKGEKAKVMKIDEAKDELTVELMEIAVPIPVTIKPKTVKLYQKVGAEN